MNDHKMIINDLQTIAILGLKRDRTSNLPPL